MTLTTAVRINWPVPAEALLDHLTVVVGGDPKTVKRRRNKPGDQPYLPGTYTVTKHEVYNAAMQGLGALLDVEWSEQPDLGSMDEEDPEDNWPQPPALVILSMDNPYGSWPEHGYAHGYHATVLLPAVRDWLDDHGVPRESWWWEDESYGTFHPGTVDVALLAESGKGGVHDHSDRETWEYQCLTP